MSDDPGPKSTKAEYIRTQLAIIKIGKDVSALNLFGFLAQISRAEAVAPILDPTLYRKAAGNLNSIKKLAECLVPVQIAYAETLEAVIETAARGDMRAEPSE